MRGLHSISPGGRQIQAGAIKGRGEICNDTRLHADAAGFEPRKAGREESLLMDSIFMKNKDGWYLCPVCGIRFGEQYVSAGKCPACGFHPPGKKIKSLNDCTKCLHEDVCNFWYGQDRICVGNLQHDGCSYYRDKSRYICVDDINGPGPDPRGEEGDPGYMSLNARVDGLRDYINAIWTYICTKEAAQCGDASGRGNG